MGKSATILPMSGWNSPDRILTNEFNKWATHLGNEIVEALCSSLWRCELSCGVALDCTRTASVVAGPRQSIFNLEEV